MTLFDEPGTPLTVPSPPPMTDGSDRWHPGLPYVRLIVRGDPVQQGSMVGYASRNPGATRGFVQVKPDNEAELKPWRAHIAGLGARAMVVPGGTQLRPPLDGPLAVSMTFSLPRPKSVTRTYPNVRPDLDKLVRAVCDALGQGDGSKAKIGAVIADDSRIIALEAHKVYAGLAGPEALPFPGVTIHIWQLADD